jgi:transcriptional regulator of acetoin/glycerol metabolism
VETYPANEIEIHPHRDFPNPGNGSERVSDEFDRTGDMDRLRIVGETPAMQELRKNIERVAPLDCTVTLHGEPGTGKELAARAIHAGSMHNRRFLAINCANFGSSNNSRASCSATKAAISPRPSGPAAEFSAPVRWGHSFST